MNHKYSTVFLRTGMKGLLGLIQKAEKYHNGKLEGLGKNMFWKK